MGAAAGTESFWSGLDELGRDYLKNVWMLARPTIMLLLTLVPWRTLLSEITPLRVFLVSMIAVFMPVPIALEVMFAAVPYQPGVAGGYGMKFLMTLGTFGIVPAIYLWREVSKPLAVSLYLFFLAVGCVTGLVL